MAKTIKYPGDDEQFNDLRAYLNIRMYIPTSKGSFSTISDMFVNVAEQLGGATFEIFEAGKKLVTNGDFTDFVGNSVTTLKKKIKNIQDINLDISLITAEMEDGPIFTFNTYVPAEMALNVVSTWQESELFSKTEGAIKGLGKLTTAISGFVGKGAGIIFEQYETIKNQFQYLSAVGITPPKIKIFEPSFLDQDIEWDFYPETKTEADNILLMGKIFKESQIPYSNDGEIFKFPAIFKMKVIMNGDIVTNDNDDVADMYFNFENLGLETFSITPISTESASIKVKADGKLSGYKVTMKFTSITKKYSDELVTDRIEKYTNQIKE